MVVSVILVRRLWISRFPNNPEHQDDIEVLKMVMQACFTIAALTT